MASEPVQQAFFSEVLHTSVPDLVRAAVTRDDGYWEALAPELRPPPGPGPVGDATRVPVEDRIIAWLCAHDERAAAEEFLEYAFDNQQRLPHSVCWADRPHITLPFIDALSAARPGLTPVADADLRYRARLLGPGGCARGVAA